ncbi:hypothetical protein KJN74_04615 [Candidatus Bathyarchaeota archaeon]|nr:hypothetical protein [Candidatus Bathyarchaeota archaeon]
MKQLLVHRIDLLKINGNGDFLCPCCRTKISPEDETRKIYSVLEAKLQNDELENLMIQCKICSNIILLTGFSILKR